MPGHREEVIDPQFDFLLVIGEPGLVAGGVSVANEVDRVAVGAERGVAGSGVDDGVKFPANSGDERPLLELRKTRDIGSDAQVVLPGVWALSSTSVFHPGRPLQTFATTGAGRARTICLAARVAVLPPAVKST